jgi:hypothetical protein
MLGILQVFEAVSAEVPKAGAGRRVRGNEDFHRLRDEDLASVSSGADAGGTVHVQSNIVTGAAEGLTGVQAHAHAQSCALGPRVLRERPLSRYCRPYRLSGPRECHQEGISLPIDLLAVSFLERGTEQASMFLLDLRVPAVAEALEKRGGPLDVGEEEGDGPGR